MSNNRDHLVGWLNWNQTNSLRCFYTLRLYIQVRCLGTRKWLMLNVRTLPIRASWARVHVRDQNYPLSCLKHTNYPLFKRNKSYLLLSLHHLPKQALCVNLRLIHIWLLLVQVLILMIAAPSSGPFRLVEVFCSISNQDFMGTLGLGLLLTGSPTHTIWRGLSPILRLALTLEGFISGNWQMNRHY